MFCWTWHSLFNPKVNLKKKMYLYMLTVTLLPKGVQHKAIKTFLIEDFSISICHWCQRQRCCTMSCEYLREFSKILQNVQKRILRGLGKNWFMKKKQRSRGTAPFRWGWGEAATWRPWWGTPGGRAPPRTSTKWWVFRVPSPAKNHATSYLFLLMASSTVYMQCRFIFLAGLLLISLSSLCTFTFTMATFS